MNLIVSLEEIVPLLLTSGAGANGEKRELGWQDGPQSPGPQCLTYLQLIEVICAIFPRQTLHNAWHW